MHEKTNNPILSSIEVSMTGVIIPRARGNAAHARMKRTEPGIGSIRWLFQAAMKLDNNTGQEYCSVNQIKKIKILVRELINILWEKSQ